MEGGAAFWFEFYDRLVADQSQALATMEDYAKGLSGEDLRVAETLELEPLRGLIAEFKRRADLWRAIDSKGEVEPPVELEGGGNAAS